MRKAIIAANWKMNMTVAETVAYIKTFLTESRDDTDVDVVIIPPFTALAAASQLISEAYSLKLGAQNMHAQKSGAFTGEISAGMLRELFVRYVILGHSERRQLFGETDAIINEKMVAAHAASLKPIFCVGETLAERDGGWPDWTRRRFRRRSSLTNPSGPSAPDATPPRNRRRKHMRSSAGKSRKLPARKWRNAFASNMAAA